MPTPSLLQRLKERKLVQWAVAYLAGGWFLVESINLAVDRFHWPEMIGQVTIILAAIGFLITLVLAWYHGEKGRQRVSGPELLMVAALLVVAGVALSALGSEENPSLAPFSTPSRLAGDNRPGIAVLLCANMSTDPDDEYLAASLHDEVLLKLQGISSLFTIGRASVEWYRENPAPLPQVARELGVAFVGECSVQKYEDRIRLIFQLSDGSTGGHIWADDFDRDVTVGNLLDVQIEIAQAIVSALAATLTPGERERIAAVPTEDDIAYQFYLQGRDYDLRPGAFSEDLEAAEDLYRRAISLDPSFALAHARLSIVHSEMTAGDPSGARLTEQRAEAEEALRLQPTLPEARMAMARVHFAEDEFDGALEELEAALEGLPNDMEVILRIGDTHVRLGNPSLAIAAYEQAARLDPRVPETFYRLGRRYRMYHRYEDALAALDRCLALAPTYRTAARQKGLLFLQWKGQLDTLKAVLDHQPGLFSTRLKLELWERDPGGVFALLGSEPDSILTGGLTRSLFSAWAHRLEGDLSSAQAAFDSARVLLERLAAEDPQRISLHYGLGYAYAGLGRSADAARSVQLFLEAAQGDESQVPTDAERGAQILAQAGLVDEAIGLLEPLLDGPSWTSVKSVEVEFVYDPIRDHPRFQALLEKYRDDVEH